MTPEEEEEFRRRLADLQLRQDAIETRINEQGARIDPLWQKIVDLDKLYEPLAEKYKAVLAQSETIASKLNKIDDQLLAVSPKIDAFLSFFAEYFDKPSPDMKSKMEMVADHQASIENFNKSSLALKQEIEIFRDYIYGNKEANIPGFKKDAEDLVIGNKKQMTSWEQTYDALKVKIEGLLPGATTTGLAGAFQDQRKAYNGNIMLWTVVLGVCVVAMCIFGAWFITYSKNDSWDKVALHLLTRITFIVPVAWIAFFSAKKLNQFLRLKEEYGHKETVAKSFEGYRRELEKLANADEKNTLLAMQLKIMVEMLSANPSLTLEHPSHDEKNPVESIAKTAAKSLTDTVSGVSAKFSSD